MNTDVLIVGSGCSGLYCALNLPRNLKITMITKSSVEGRILCACDTVHTSECKARMPPK